MNRFVAFQGVAGLRTSGGILFVCDGHRLKIARDQGSWSHLVAWRRDKGSG